MLSWGEYQLSALNTLSETKILNSSPKRDDEHLPPSGGYSTKLYAGGLRPDVQALLCTNFDGKGTPFVYPLLTKMTPLSHT